MTEQYASRTPISRVRAAACTPVLALALAASVLAPAHAQTTEAEWQAIEKARYAACLERAEVEPEEAFEDAATWAFEGGGVHARHCSGMALLSMGRLDDAAARLESAGLAPDAGAPDQRAAILTQAGNAWLLAFRPRDAERAFTFGLEALPGNADLLIDRARAYAEQDRLDDAVVDLTDALAARADDVLALRLRADARLNTGDVRGAERDVRAALLAAPDDIETLVVRGRVREAQRLAGLTLMD